MKKFHVFALVGAISLLLGIISAYMLNFICSQEHVNLMAETLVGIATVSLLGNAVVFSIISYRVKEGL